MPTLPIRRLISIMRPSDLSQVRRGRTSRASGALDSGSVSRREKISRAKAQRRKERSWQRGSALRLCAFAREILLWFTLLVMLSSSAFGQANSDRWLDYAPAEYDIFPNVTYAKASNFELKLDLYLP